MKRAHLTLLLALFLATAMGGIWFLTSDTGNGAGEQGLAIGAQAPLVLGQEGPLPEADLAGLVSEDDGGRAMADAALTEATSARSGVRGRWKPPITAQWIEGRVNVEAGLPMDEEIFVLAEGRSFSSDPDSPDTFRAKVEPSGEFRVAFSPDTRRGRLILQAKYAYLKTPEVVKLSSLKDGEELVLEAELGGRIVVEVLPPASQAFAEDVLDGIEVEAKVGRWTSVPKLEGTRLQKAIFELGGARDDQAYVVSAVSDRFADGKLDGVKVAPGQTEYVEVALSRGAHLAGTVRDGQGNPILAGKVMAMSQQEARSRNPIFNQATGTEAEILAGKFEMHGVRPGETMVVVEADGYLELQHDLGLLFDGDDRNSLSLMLSQGGIVSGVVRWPDGEPARGAEVRIAQEDGIGNFDFEMVHDTITLGPDGAFSFAALKEGKCAVTAVCVERGWELPEDATLAQRKFGAKPPLWRVHEERVSPGRSNLELVLQPGSNVMGVVTDDIGEPIKKFRVIASPADQGFLSSNGVRAVKKRFEHEKGKFEVEGLMAGTWKIRVQAAGYGTGKEHEIRAPYEGVLRVDLPRAGALVGEVRTPDGGSAKGARVNVSHSSNGNMNATAAKDGSFKVSKVDPGSVSLVARLEGYASSLPLKLEVGADSTQEDLVLDLRAGARIAGELHKDVGGKASRGVQLEGPSASSTKTDKQGRFEFTGLEPGDYKVTLSPESSSGNGRSKWLLNSANQRSLDVSVGVGQSVTVLLGEPPATAVTMEGRVLDDGEPVPGALIMAYLTEAGQESGASAGAEADSDGRYNLVLDEPGSYNFQVGREVGQLSSIPLDVPTSGTFRHDFELPGGRLFGVVLGPDGNPVGDIFLTLSLEKTATTTGRSRWARTQQQRTTVNGTFEFEDLGPGTYNLRAGSFRGRRDLANMLYMGLEVTEDEATERTIRLPLGGVIEGVLLDSVGEPINRAQVWVENEDGQKISEFGEGRTDKNGSYKLRSVAPGEVYVVARKDGKTSEPVRVRVTEAGLANASLSLSLD
ncbi:MAG: protocatechuate 3,4-dioxygenase beta subunit [Planctomycetota bacterium]|jgi:protocatechuate 3,4-dioxygenase beta subunit